MSALSDFNTVATYVLGALYTAFPTPTDLDPLVVVVGAFHGSTTAQQTATRNALVYLVQSGYIISRDERLDPTLIQGAVLSTLGLQIYGLPTSLQPAT